jgi:hypothetical protein
MGLAGGCCVLTESWNLDKMKRRRRDGGRGRGVNTVRWIILYFEGGYCYIIEGCEASGAWSLLCCMILGGARYNGGPRGRVV